jgi:hypothetical protein
MDRFVGYARLQGQRFAPAISAFTPSMAFMQEVEQCRSNCRVRTFCGANGTHSVPYLTPEFGIRNNKPLLSFIKVNLLPQTAWLIPNSGFEYERQLRLTGVDLNLKSVDTILRDADPLNALMPFAKCIV